MSRKGILIEDAFHMIQKIDSEDDVDSFSESFESEECDVDNIQDPDFETESISESDDPSILQPFSRKQVQYTNEYKIFELQSGCKWARKSNIACNTNNVS